MKKFISLLFAFVLMLSMLPEAKANTTGFKDVPKSHTNYTEIMYLLENGVIAPSDKFNPNEKVTREEVAVMVAKAIGLDGTKTNTKFKDVPESRYSSGYINSAVNAGILNGYPDGTFKPTQPVTRGHMAAFIANAFKLTEQADVNFKDVLKGSTSYIAVRKLAAANITSGYPDGTFKPNEGLTRAHISAFLARAMNPNFRPQPKKVATRGIDFSMSIQQVRTMESAKLISDIGDSTIHGLTYETRKFDAYVHLTYMFDYGKLKYIIYDFLPDKNSYHTSSEMKALHTVLLNEAVKELGRAEFTSADSYSNLFSSWKKDGYSVMLNVNDDKIYTSAQLVFYK